MERDFFSVLIDTIKLIRDPNVENNIKEHAIKSILKQGVDIQPNYSHQTKDDLKKLIDLAQNEDVLFRSIITYFCTHHIGY